MALAIVLGAASGALGFLPLYWGLRMTRQAAGSNSIGYALFLLLGVVLSFAVLAIAAAACVALAKDLAIAFVLAEAIALSAAAIAYGVHKQLGK